MKTLVTGGGGFLGLHLVKALRAAQHDVRVLCRGVYPALIEMGAEVVLGDVSNEETVMRAVQGVDVVFHAAAKTGYWGNYDDYYQTNVRGSLNIIDACGRAGVKRLIYTSSPSVTMNNIDIHDGDESLPYPKKYFSHYQRTKAMAERAVLDANGKDGLLTVALRPHLLLGPGDNHLMPKLIERAKKNRLIQIGEGQNKVSVCFIENAAHAHLRAMDARDIGGKAYFINEPMPINLWEWLNGVIIQSGLPAVRKKIGFQTAYAIGAALEFMHKALPFLGEPQITRFLASELSKNHYFSIANARADLGFESVVPWADCEQQIIQFCRSYLNS